MYLLQKLYKNEEKYLELSSFSRFLTNVNHFLIPAPYCNLLSYFYQTLLSSGIKSPIYLGDIYLPCLLCMLSHSS